MVLDAAKRGEGTRLIENLNDPEFKGMEKWEVKVTSDTGLDSIVHYVKDPKTGEIKDLKFKAHNIQGRLGINQVEKTSKWKPKMPKLGK
jgi:hypothetical protein